MHCVFGVLTTEKGIEIQKEMLEWLLPAFDVSTIKQEPPGTLFEYPAINFALHKCCQINKPCMYIHTKGASNDKPSAAKIRNIWKDQYMNHFQDYLGVIDVNKPMVVCPYTGQTRRRTWFNSWIITPPAASILLKTFHIDENRYYYERLFVDQPDIEIKGILSNDCDWPADVLKMVDEYGTECKTTNTEIS